MNKLEMDVAMLRAKKSAEDLGEVIGLTRVSFNKRRYGEMEFGATEIKKVSLALGLSLEEVNTIFFDGELPECKYKPACAKQSYNKASQVSIEHS